MTITENGLVYELDDETGEVLSTTPAEAKFAVTEVKVGRSSPWAAPRPATRGRARSKRAPTGIASASIRCELEVSTAFFFGAGNSRFLCKASGSVSRARAMASRSNGSSKGISAWAGRPTRCRILSLAGRGGILMTGAIRAPALADPVRRQSQCAIGSGPAHCAAPAVGPAMGRPSHKSAMSLSAEIFSWWFLLCGVSAVNVMALLWSARLLRQRQRIQYQHDFAGTEEGRSGDAYHPRQLRSEILDHYFAIALHLVDQYRQPLGAMA